MKKGYSHISFILDNSGSMSPLRKDTISGYNKFLKGQKEDPGTMTFSLYQFNMGNFGGMPFLGGVGGALGAPIMIGGGLLPWSTPVPNEASAVPNVRTTYEFIPLTEVPDLNETSYKCDTNTPLLDAIGYGLKTTGKLLAALNEADRPEYVIFVILTDGEENASNGFTKEKINELIKHQTDVYKWQFIFLGANQDAIQAGGALGISAMSSMNFAADSGSVGATYSIITRSLSDYKKSGVAVSYSDKEREDVLKGVQN